MHRKGEKDCDVRVDKRYGFESICKCCFNLFNVCKATAHLTVQNTQERKAADKQGGSHSSVSCP